MRGLRRPSPGFLGTIAGAWVVAWVAMLPAGVDPAAGAEPPAGGVLRPDRVRMLVEQFKRARAPEDRETVAAELLGGGPDAAAKLLTVARAELGRLRQPYAVRFQRAAVEVLEKRGRAGAQRVEIAEWRKTILEVAAAEPLTKELIETRSDPALARLEALLAVAPADVLEADPRLAHDRDEILALADVVRRCVACRPDGTRKPARPDADAGRLAEDIAAAEELACLLAGPLTPVDREVVAANAALARDLDPEEARGVTRLNVIRVLVGLPAQAIDLKLVAACRGHSRDMDERGFFDHQSPVPGRETPWARAEAAGTSANAENIFTGVPEGPTAIRAWWHSPGHHKNMLGGQQRTGLGRWKQFWTQLFG